VCGQVLRAFRLLRVFKLLRSWRPLQKVLNALLGSAQTFAHLMILLALVLFIFAVLGMNLFGNQFRPPMFDEVPRTNFDSIPSAMITVFIVTVGEGWTGAHPHTHAHARTYARGVRSRTHAHARWRRWACAYRVLHPLR
jgi:hypothetical protein